MFRLEPIYEINGTARVWGYEVLHANPFIPNDVLFAVPNVSLEIYLFRSFLKGYENGYFPTGVSLTFNMSPEALLSCAREVSDALENFENVYIEVTEHGFRGYLDGIRELPVSLKRRLILDDFLTKYASFSLLFSVNPHGIKLEPVLVTYVDLEKLMSHSEVIIAEKVETAEDFKTFQDFGITHFQGHYVSKIANRHSV